MTDAPYGDLEMPGFVRQLYPLCEHHSTDDGKDCVTFTSDGVKAEGTAIKTWHREPFGAMLAYKEKFATYIWPGCKVYWRTKPRLLEQPNGYAVYSRFEVK